MTVYPSVEDARIPPHKLNSSVPSSVLHWFVEAEHVYHSQKDYSYKAGYLYGIIKILKDYFTIHENN